MEKLLIGDIYKIRNKINNKVYIGQTIYSTEKRVKEHCRTNKNLPLYNAFKKYGTENFEVIILEENIDNNLLDSLEKYYINKYDSYNNGYNMTKGGKGYNSCHSKETRNKIRESMSNPKIKERIFTLERIEKLRKSLTGKKFTKEHRRKLSEAAKKRCGEKNSFFGKSHTNKTKELISNKNSKSVAMYKDDNLIHIFKNGKEVAKYLKNTLGLATSEESIYRRINWKCLGKERNLYYGYSFKFYKV